MLLTPAERLKAVIVALSLFAGAAYAQDGNGGRAIPHPVTNVNSPAHARGGLGA